MIETHYMMKETSMKLFFDSASGAAVGLLLYTRFLSETHQFDWERAVFIPLFVGLARSAPAAVWRKKAQE
jgi:hypothetical protein